MPGFEFPREVQEEQSGPWGPWLSSGEGRIIEPAAITTSFNLKGRRGGLYFLNGDFSLQKQKSDVDQSEVSGHHTASRLGARRDVFLWDGSECCNQPALLHWLQSHSVSLNLCKWLEKEKNLASYASSFMPGSAAKLGIDGS